MPKYRVGGTVTISMYIDIEAESPEAAKEAARGAPVMHLCHHCSGVGDDGEWRTSGDLDGDPEPTDETPEIAPNRRRR